MIATFISFFTNYFSKPGEKKFVSRKKITIFFFYILLPPNNAMKGSRVKFLMTALSNYKK